jgi:cytochrome d ubiquinol oxidase subunit I
VDPEFLSRIQFAFTISFHFIYPPISMGLGVLLVYMGWKYVRTKDPVWRQASFFWVKVYGLVFAMGIATGIVQEFEFGTNWAAYSRFVGNIFGSLLAAGLGSRLLPNTSLPKPLAQVHGLTLARPFVRLQKRFGSVPPV